MSGRQARGRGGVVAAARYIFRAMAGVDDTEEGGGEREGWRKREKSGAKCVGMRKMGDGNCRMR